MICNCANIGSQGVSADQVRIVRLNLQVFGNRGLVLLVASASLVALVALELTRQRGFLSEARGLSLFDNSVDGSIVVLAVLALGLGLGWLLNDKSFFGLISFSSVLFCERPGYVLGRGVRLQNDNLRFNTVCPTLTLRRYRTRLPSLFILIADCASTSIRLCRCLLVGLT